MAEGSWGETRQAQCGAHLFSHSHLIVHCCWWKWSHHLGTRERENSGVENHRQLWNWPGKKIAQELEFSRDFACMNPFGLIGLEQLHTVAPTIPAVLEPRNFCCCHDEVARGKRDEWIRRRKKRKLKEPTPELAVCEGVRACFCGP